MQERKITAAELDAIIRLPDEWISQGPKWIAMKHIGNRSDNYLAAVLLERKEYTIWVVLSVMNHFQKRR